MDEVQRIHRVAAGAGGGRRERQPTVRLALAQLDCVPGDPGANLLRARSIVRTAGGDGADLVVFPELFTSGHAPAEPPAAVAVRADDERIAAVAAAGGKDVSVLLGFTEQGPDGRYYNAAAYCEGGRVAFIQRKVCLVNYHIFTEGRRFAAGTAIRTHPTSFGRMAILICNDAWQPALAAMAAYAGADILLIPANSADSEFSKLIETRQAWMQITQCYARLLQCHVVFVNRVGTEPGMRFWGRSHVVDHQGQLLTEAPPYDEAVQFASIGVEQARQWRNDVPLLGHRPLEALREGLAQLEAGET